MSMTREEAEIALRGGAQGIRAWNAARERDSDWPDLDRINLMSCDLRHANLSGVNLCEADLRGADLSMANLSAANLVRAKLCAANLTKAQLAYADLWGADLGGAKVTEANFVHTAFGLTLVAGDFSDAIGLDSVIHYDRSNITVATLLSFKEELPEQFLRGCRIPEPFIALTRSFLGLQKSVRTLSCFISYSSKNEDFARHLYGRMREAGLEVWFAPEDVQGGKKLNEQIKTAILRHDKLLIVLSEESMASQWVMTELHNAFAVERVSGKRKLFPVRLVDFEKLRVWKCPDAESGIDLAREVREYFIPDFSDWKEDEQFERAFARLLKDLKEETKAG